jgi:hypothetical protein
MERKKELIFPIIFDKLCTVYNNVYENIMKCILMCVLLMSTSGRVLVPVYFVSERKTTNHCLLQVAEIQQKSMLPTVQCQLRLWIFGGLFLAISC